MYVLESVKKLKARRVNQKSDDKRQTGKAQKILTEAPVRQFIYVDPETFKIRKIIMDDTANSRNLNIAFSDFVAVDKQLYPGAIFLHFLSPENNMELRIRLSNFSVEEEKDIRFKVPDNFTRLNNN
jgi:hypothetical protein